MKNINTIAEKCKAILEKLGIQYSPYILDYRINPRLTSTLGRSIYYRKTQDFIIELSSRIMKEEVADEFVETVMLHELLHTCRGCQNHGTQWQRYARKVTRETGYEIVTKIEVSKLEQYNVPVKKKTEHKYIFRCKGCGQTIWRDRTCDIVLHPENFRCGICKGDLERIK